MTTEKKSTSPVPYPTAGTEPKPSKGQTEEALWKQLLDDPENEEKHKIYFNFILRSGQVREGLRRYSTIIEEKDDFSINARRQSRRFHKTLLDLLFLGGPRERPQGKRPFLEYLAFFIATFLIVLGISIPSLLPFLFIGLGTLAVTIVWKVRTMRRKSKGGENPP